MKFPDDAPVTAEKKAALRERLARLAIDLAAVDEQAIRGSGPGGQKKNKTSSGVLLRYPLPRTAPSPNSGAGSGAGSGDGSSGGPPGSAPADRPDDEPPRLLVVRCSRERQHSLNRFLALRELADAVEQRVSPETSARLQEIARRRKQKARQASRSRQRAQAHAADSDPGPDPGPDPDPDPDPDQDPAPKKE